MIVQKIIIIEHIFTTLLLTEHWATDRLERPRMPTLQLQNKHTLSYTLGFNNLTPNLTQCGFISTSSLRCLKHALGMPRMERGCKDALKNTFQNLLKQGSTLERGFLHTSGHADKGSPLEWTAN
mgnify:CR=1 FL=1